MKKKKSILTLAIGLLMILSLVAVLPMVTAAPNPCSIRGYVYVDSVITKPDQVTLIFPVQEDINATLFDDPYGFYTADFSEEAGVTVIFYVTIPGGTWEALENVTIENGVTMYYPTNLTIDTSLPPINEAPTADAGGPYNGVVGTPVAFDGSGSSDDGTIVSYEWDFGDGNTGTGVNPSHTYTTTFTDLIVNLMVTDNDGATDTDTTTVTITEPTGDDDDDYTPPPPSDDDDDSGPPPGDDDDDTGGSSGYTPPNADASLSQKFGNKNEVINFDGSESTGSITSYTWDFGDGNTGTGVTSTHIYTTPDTYTVTLTVSDGTNTDTDSITVVIAVGNIPPEIPTIVTGEPTGAANTEYTCAAMSTDADNDTIKYTFAWGDGETTTTELLPNGTTTEQKHTYASAGKYTIQVTANDNSTDSETTTYSVLIDAIDLEYNETYVGYMTDDDGDGTWDKFHATGVETDVELQEDGTYLIDSDGDGEPDYVYDPDTGELTLYSAEVPVEPNNSVWLMLGVGLVLAVLVVAGIAFFMKKKK